MKQVTKTIAKQVASYYWKKVWKYPFSFIGITILVPLTTLIGYFLPTLILSKVLRRLSDGDFTAGQPLQSFSSEIVLYGSMVFLTGFVLWRLVDVLLWRLEGSIQRDIAQEVFNKLSDESANFHANNFSGSLVSQTNKLISSYVRIADTTIFNTYQLIASLVFTSILLARTSPLYVVALLILSITFVTVAFFASKPVRRATSLHSKSESAQTGYLADVIGNVMAVKSFAGEKHEKANFAKASEQTRMHLNKVMRSHMKQMLYFSAISRATSIIALIIAVISVVTYNADIATVFLIFSYTSLIIDKLFEFSNGAIRNYNRSIGDASEMVKILSQDTEVKDPLLPEKSNMHRGAIVFSEVSFKHKNAEGPIFNRLDLKIKPGEKVGLVGQSGSGKTSLTRILLRFSDINSGSIKIDGQDIRSVSQADLRRSISYVPQEPILFHRTIAENIAYGRPEASQQEIEAISRKANADEFIQTLPEKYDTIVGERGVKLSGGQRQRIAIARAMLKNAPILVLDEATSALDSESESLIQDALWKLMEGRTAIVIAHRLSTIQKMDRIIVLKNGKIIEEGSHKDLLYKKGAYAKLWDRQSGGFIEEA